MKKTLAVLLAATTLACGAVGLSACKKDEVIKVGVTNYEPMDYLDESGKWIGFDAELAEKVFSNLGYKIEFVEIDWETKIVTLQSKEIDVIWNGMTVTDELKENILLSDVYLENRQYGIVKTENAEAYTDASSLKNKKVAVESGSAAEGLVKDIECTLNKLGTQSAAVMEVAAGTSDIAVIDYTMATTLTSEGSDYYGKLKAVDLGFAVEEYAVGFRKDDTKLCADVNTQLAALKTEGFLKTLAEKYGVENLLKA